ncbi:MAG: TetR/AcrR family transcriptional regulator [Aquamicrobium sp.]|nr:TetR/AcrR family transcriptional regulator [Aquamicrobium sp.]
MHDYVEFLEQKLANARNDRKTVRTELQIEIATATLLRTKAYHSVSVDMIAEQAKLAHGTFYRYFAGKTRGHRQDACRLFRLHPPFAATRPARGLGPRSHRDRQSPLRLLFPAECRTDALPFSSQG